MTLGRFIERLMLLDVVLGDKKHCWMGTEKDKVGYFRKLDDCDRLVFVFLVRQPSPAEFRTVRVAELY